MTYARRQDSNAADIVKALRKVGFQVFDLGRMAKFIPGFPDLLVICFGQPVLAEVKTPKGKLTQDQVDFHAAWSGPPIITLRSVEDAVAWAGKERLKRFMQ